MRYYPRVVTFAVLGVLVNLSTLTAASNETRGSLRRIGDQLTTQVDRSAPNTGECLRAVLGRSLGDHDRTQPHLLHTLAQRIKVGKAMAAVSRVKSLLPQLFRVGLDEETAPEPGAVRQLARSLNPQP